MNLEQERTNFVISEVPFENKIDVKQLSFRNHCWIRDITFFYLEK